jgi:DNA mismatch endonuclease (patch repair protein)
MPLTRSEQMSRVRSRDTRPEVLLRSAAWRAGLRYRVSAPSITGRPDLVFPGARVAVFIDGCFWHGCPEHYVAPRSSTEFWSKKLVENVRRDQRQTAELERGGWRVLRLWEHEVYESVDEVVRLLLDVVRGGQRPSPDAAWRVAKVQPLEGAGGLEERTLVTLCPESAAVRLERRSRSTSKSRPRRSLTAPRTPT